MSVSSFLSLVGLSFALAQSSDALTDAPAPSDEDAGTVAVFAAEPEVPEPLSVEEIALLLGAEGVPPEEIPLIAEQLHADMVLEASLTFEGGVIDLQRGLATLTLPEDYLYLTPVDASRVLQAWGNPGDEETLGMIVPADTSLFSQGGWAVLLSFEADGYVDDEDADDIDWDELLVEMQDSTEMGNEARFQAGLVPIHLEAWAEPPHYDGERSLLYWATTLVNDEGGRSLNYDVRVLGRRGVLAMSAIAPVEQLAEVKVEMEGVIHFAAFNEGHRHADFDPELDDVAAYGVGALVAGKLASKAGLFAVIGAALLKGKKLLILGAIALASVGRRFFGGKGGGDVEG